MTTIAPQPHAIGNPGYSQTWPREPQSAGRARSLVCAALETWRLGQLANSGGLIVSELVGNSVKHTKCHLIRVSISLTSPGCVRLSVSDKSTACPLLQRPEVNAESGRGLFLVNELADRWGTDRRRWGKIVWAELRRVDE